MGLIKSRIMVAWILWAGLCGLSAGIGAAAAAEPGDAKATAQQIESVQAYVVRTREWSREDFEVKEVVNREEDGEEAMPTFVVTLLSDRVQHVTHGERFEVYLDRRSFVVVGEHTADPRAPRQ